MYVSEREKKKKRERYRAFHFGKVVGGEDDEEGNLSQDIRFPSRDDPLALSS